MSSDVDSAWYGIQIHGLVILSNLAHLLLSPQSPQQLAAFMEYHAGNWSDATIGRAFTALEPRATGLSYEALG